MNLKKWILAIFSVIIILTIILIILLTIPKKEIEEKPNKGNDTEKITIEYGKIVKVKDRNTFFTVSSCVDKYLLEVLSQDIQNIYDLLATDYIANQQITSNNILSKIEKIDVPQIFSGKVMYEINYTDSISVYYVEGTIRDDTFEGEYEKETPINIAVQLDKVNRTYAVIPNATLPSPDAIPEITISKIEPNQSNTYYSVNMLDAQMANTYLQQFTELLQRDIKEAYNKLQEEYKQKRFPTQKDLENYVATKGKYILEPQIESVNVKKTEEETIYTIKDYNENFYIVKEKGVFDYTIELDDYTLENTSFEKTYEQLNDKDKSLLNLNKFFKMLNMQDYENAYALLDETFKQNNFDTLEKFESYVKSNLFLLNKVNYTSYNGTIAGLYSYKAIITDATEQNEKQITINLVVKLLEGTDFVMSFSMN